MSMKSRGLRVFLAALLIFSQHLAVLHVLGHDVARLSRPDSTDPQELVCVKCLAIAHLDHAASGDVPIFTAIPTAADRVSDVAVLHRDLPFVARYRSRAPPLPS